MTPTKPITAAAMPPISVHTALSVGDPVKNRETSELNEFVAVTPMTMSTTPPARRAREIILFIMSRLVEGLSGGLQALPTGDEIGEHHDDGDHQQDMNQA